MTNQAPGARREKPPMPENPALREREERLEGLSALAGRLVHDFNNFIAPVHGYLTLIKEDAPSPTTQNYVAMMENSSRRIEGVMEAALLAVRPQRIFRPEHLDFTALLETVIREWWEALPATARITVKKDLAPCMWDADPAHWRQALLQVLHNARFALVTGGILEISLQPSKLTPAEAADLGVASTDGFKLVFRDHGFGMSPATLRRACEPFFSTRLKGQAMGLGLTVVHGVTRLHGGQMTLESTEDVGTTVTLWLPHAPATYKAYAGGSPAGNLPPSEPRPVGQKILLVDDDPMVREVLKTYLQREKFEVYVAADGAEGLKLFEKHHEKLGLVISDMTMPVMDGIEFAERLRRISPNMPLLLISGDTDFAVQEGLARLGVLAPELVKKPFAMKAFLDKVRGYLGA